MAHITAEALIILASLSSLIRKGVTRKVDCLVLFGEPDFSEIEADISEN